MEKIVQTWSPRLLSVLRIVAAHDSGRIINPLLAESQLEGGILHQQALDFLVVDGLDLAPELANVLLGVVTGKDFAEAFEGQHTREHFRQSRIVIDDKNGGAL